MDNGHGCKSTKFFRDLEEAINVVFKILHEKFNNNFSLLFPPKHAAFNSLLWSLLSTGPIAILGHNVFYLAFQASVFNFSILCCLRPQNLFQMPRNNFHNAFSVNYNPKGNFSKCLGRIRKTFPI